MNQQNDSGDKSGERIAKVIARAGLASRRTAEEWVAAGRVAVNGAVIHSPALNVTAQDRISVDGEPLPARERTRLFLYYKPRGLVTSHADPQGRPTLFERLPKELPRLVSVGRLDFNTEGLILLTNDGALARALELPATGWLRRYRVRAHGSVTQRTLDELRTGVTVDGIKYREIEATVDRVQGANLWLTFAIREGKNREVRNVLGHLGLTVNRLIRVSFGPFQLGELSEGEVEEVPTRVLREQLGERLVELRARIFRRPFPPRDGRTRAKTRAAIGRENPRAPAGTTPGATNRPNKKPHARPRRATRGGSPKKRVREKNCGGSFTARAATKRRIPPARPKVAARRYAHRPQRAACDGRTLRSTASTRTSARAKSAKAAGAAAALRLIVVRDRGHGTRGAAECESSADGCVGGRSPAPNRKTSARPRIVCANPCSTFSPMGSATR